MALKCIQSTKNLERDEQLILSIRIQFMFPFGILESLLSDKVVDGALSLQFHVAQIIELPTT